MFCMFCGSNINDNSSFCPNCGQQLKTGNTVSNSVASNKKSKAKKWIIIAAIAGTVLTLFFVIFIITVLMLGGSSDESESASKQKHSAKNKDQKATEYTEEYQDYSDELWDESWDESWDEVPDESYDESWDGTGQVLLDGSVVTEKRVYTEKDVTDELKSLIFEIGLDPLYRGFSSICSNKHNLFLYNYLDEEPSLYWKIGGDITGDPEPERLVIGNAKDKLSNKIYVVYRVPYEAYIEGGGEIIGSGETHVMVVISCLFLDQDGYKHLNEDYHYSWVYETPEEADADIYADSDRFDFTEYDVR